MKFEIEVTHNFKKEAKKLIKKFPSLKKELQLLVEKLEENPAIGTALGKNCFKVRISIASKGKGKSGGARVITHLHIVKNKVYLLSVYDKNEQSTLKNNELEELLSYLNL